MSSMLVSPMESLTDKQSAILALIGTEISDHRRPPTVREIAARLGISSTNAVRDHLAALERKGYIRVQPRSARGITILLTPEGRSMRSLDRFHPGTESTFVMDRWQGPGGVGPVDGINSQTGVDVTGQVLTEYHGTTDQNRMPDMFVERDDFCIVRSEGPRHYYFRDFSEWPQTNRDAVQSVRGKVLDVGCGPGRVGLHLQRLGFDVVSIDKSPGAVKVARQRGLKYVELLGFENIGALSPAKFDTVTLMCNCFGLLQSFGVARYILESLAAITSENALIIAETNDPHGSGDPVHVKYQRRNVGLHRMPGQFRIRLRYRDLIGDWFDDLSVSRDEMNALLDGSQWRVQRYIDDPIDPQYYVALIGKRKG